MESGGYYLWFGQLLQLLQSVWRFNLRFPSSLYPTAIGLLWELLYVCPMNIRNLLANYYDLYLYFFFFAANACVPCMWRVFFSSVQLDVDSRSRDIRGCVLSLWEPNSGFGRKEGWNYASYVGFMWWFWWCTSIGLQDIWNFGHVSCWENLGERHVVVPGVIRKLPIYRHEDIVW